MRNSPRPVRALGALLPAAAVMGVALAGQSVAKQSSRATGDGTQPRGARTKTARLPLAFEQNLGQTDAQVDFVARGDGYSLFLTPTQAVISLRAANQAPGRPTFRRPGSDRATVLARQARNEVVRMSLVGANLHPQVRGADALGGRSHYLRGSNRKTWVKDVPTFGRVRYAGVYPGVDLVYYGNNRQLEYDFLVQPGSDPSAIRLKLGEAGQTRIHGDGSARLRLTSGELCLQKPVVYQESAGKRVEIAASYRLDASGELGFDLAAYDRSQPLVIDPVVVYSTPLGGAGFDTGRATALDAAGAVYVTGYTEALTFPGAAGAAPGGGDAFVAKFSKDGDRLLWSAYLGGTGADLGEGIAVDAGGNVWVTGSTDSPNFPTVSPAQSSLGGGADAFVAKIAANGASLLYSTYLGGTESEGGAAITVDQSGSACLTGYTNSEDFPVTPGAYQDTFHGDYDAFVAKYGEEGGTPVFATYVGGQDGDGGLCIDTDGDGLIYVGGNTDSGDFPVDQFTFFSAFGGGRFGDGFLLELQPDGQYFTSSYMGGSGSDAVDGLGVDVNGNLLVGGTTDSNDLSIADPFYLPIQSARAGGESDAYVIKFANHLREPVYLTYLGGSGRDVVADVRVDNDPDPGKVYIFGETDSADYPVEEEFQSQLNGGTDLFISKIHEDRFLATPAVVIDYSSYFGGVGLDFAGGFSVDAVGNVGFTGYTTSPDFPLLRALPVKAGRNDIQAYVAKVLDGEPLSGGLVNMKTKINFGTLKPGAVKVANLQIKNNSRTTSLAVRVPTLTEPFGVAKGLQACFIPPNGTYSMSFKFAPTAAGTFAHTMAIRTSDPSRPVVNLAMTGTGKTPRAR